MSTQLVRYEAARTALAAAHSVDEVRVEEWVWYARQAFAPSPRSACVVCGKYQSLAQAHHAAVHILIGRLVPNAVDARVAVTLDLAREGQEILAAALAIAGRARA